MLSLVIFLSLSLYAADYHIGVVTGTVSQSEDNLRGAEALIAKYGSVADGGIIQHMTYPDNFMDEQETTISIIRGLADDPLMRAIVVNQAVSGTAEAFRQVRETRPDILLLSGDAHEEPYLIADAADVVVANDFIARGYLLIKAAHDLGCKTFVHISFPRHLSGETMSRRRAIMIEASTELGIRFVDVSAPDPVSDVGVAGAQQYIMENTPEWIKQYGQDTAFFCTNDAHTEPLIRQLVKYGGYFIEADLPSPLMGYPGALGIDLSAEAGDFTAILGKVESEIVLQGGAGRFGTWAYSFGYTGTLALGDMAVAALEAEKRGERFDLTSLRNVTKAYSALTPGAGWNGSYYIEASTGVTYRNFLLVYQDTYIMGGRGFLGNTEVEVPERFFYLTGK